ncbi:hypothetical protein B0H14DRAFT_3597932 [Mycena olivaceomarginata]|nr:hypothetical protein B0H14DRAFT_3597932 [Mycena olivaceomarginata]
MLWVSHVRAPLQAIHDSTMDREFDELEMNLRTQLRASVRDILSNMIILGATKVSAASDTALLSAYYVPGFATMTFAMVEHFVSYSGFTGDEDPVFREGIFDALSLLQCSMVAAPGYLSSPHEAPGFNAVSADPMIYGVGNHTKVNQAAEMRCNGELVHRFGSGLLRYEPELGDGAYQFPVCKLEDRLVVTRPNTPDS